MVEQTKKRFRIVGDIAMAVATVAAVLVAYSQYHEAKAKDAADTQRQTVVDAVKAEADLRVAADSSIRELLQHNQEQLNKLTDSVDEIASQHKALVAELKIALVKLGLDGTQ